MMTEKKSERQKWVTKLIFGWRSAKTLQSSRNTQLLKFESDRTEQYVPSKEITVSLIIMDTLLWELQSTRHNPEN